MSGQQKTLLNTVQICCLCVCLYICVHASSGKVCCSNGDGSQDKAVAVQSGTRAPTPLRVPHWSVNKLLKLIADIPRCIAIPVLSGIFNEPLGYGRASFPGTRMCPSVFVPRASCSATSRGHFFGGIEVSIQVLEGKTR